MATVTIVSALSPLSFTSYFDPADGSVKHARLWFYKSQTLDPVGVYTDDQLSIPHSQPVLTGGSGRVPPVFVGEIGKYRVRVFDQYDVLLEDVDGLPPASAGGGSSGGGGTTDPTLLAKTGEIKPFYCGPTQTIAGYVRCNGGTISNGAGPGNERANADCEALFKWLWQQDQGLDFLPITPNRGASSQGDWDAAKAITLPDGRNRALFGIDGQGFTNTNRLAGTTFAKGDAVKVGSYGGVPTATLTLAQTPAHNHSITDPGHYHYSVVPAHAHGYTGNQTGLESQAHSHSGTTGNESTTHTHSVPSGGTSIALPIGSASGAVVATMAGGTTGGQSVNHTHSFSTGTESANHSHTTSGTVASNGPWGVNSDSRVAGITSVSVGGGLAHEQMPPFIIVSWFIKL